MKIFYDLIFLLLSILYLPAYLFKGKLNRGVKERFGCAVKGRVFDAPIWVHAVSVGEAVVAKGLIAALRKAYPRKQFVISTVTATGNAIARTFAQEQDFVTYLPFDFSFSVNRVVSRIKPALVVIIETEIWPNFITCLKEKKIPVAVVNARISDKSFRGYKASAFMMGRIFKQVDLFCARARTDAEKLSALGVAAERIRVTGNMKFDISAPAEVSKVQNPYLAQLGITSLQRLIVAGSTHPQEEEVVLEAYRRVRRLRPESVLLLAPRHPERASEVARIVQSYDFTPVRISQLKDSSVGGESQVVFILDTIGQLMTFYALADIVFVGGSLVAKGGHNILEPAVLGKPIIFGPSMSNFQDIADLFLFRKAAVLVYSAEELQERINYLLNNELYAKELSDSARKLVLENQGATEKTLAGLRSLV